MNPRAPVALVTGGRRGLGRGIALALADAGFDVVLNDIVHDDAARQTVGDVMARGRRARFIAHDIAAVEDHARFADTAFAALNGLECLVNNAGVQVERRGDLLDVTPASYDRVMSVNLRGTFFLTQAIARRMLGEARSPRDHPRSIITISSANAFAIGPSRAEYCLSKAGLAMMSATFAHRLAGDDIMCYEVRPGIIRTDMTAVARERYDALIDGGLTPVRRWGEPEDVGRTVAALAARMLPFNTGDAFHVDGGFHLRVL